MWYSLSILIFFLNPAVLSTPPPFPNAWVRSSQNKFLLACLCILKFLNRMTHTTYSHELELFSKSSLLSIIIQPSVYLSPSPRPHGLPSQPYSAAPIPGLGLGSWCTKGSDNPGRSYSINIEVFTEYLHLPPSTLLNTVEVREGEGRVSSWRERTQTNTGTASCSL